MTILDKIVLKKRDEVSKARLRVPVSRLEEGELFQHACYSMRDFMLDTSRTGIIAEFKRASPSKGIINNRADVAKVTQEYAGAGASALSVLTDNEFFGGKKRDLVEARGANAIPLLRKDFMIDEYQVVEARALGADIILLIAAILTPAEIAKFARLAKSLGMNVLLEVHNREELDRSICEDLDAIGVNNRNLADFSVDIKHSYDLVEAIPGQFLKISESGISDVQTIRDLKSAGFNGFLIGENFMKQEDPGAAMADFVEQLKK
ncbi:indole-3-glycerol phosphate synthase TrpC [Hufsiella ginkgonis]|uniref:Indole-3-glycerol phosphate synthase n=1 Tax=Hufsiella ginkgonis TaxID=2695274 RepID=A0A7K1XSZ3_9SPHI|nr:indole-3-glycerol phosphate synthase TrpC [Hufsiella ginkgonis]MXV14123.1 indole-3-glycerol phosphate synthase TrpC [Hufsiella ginkgonis]